MRRWLTYQRERFPLAQYAPLVLVTSFCVLRYAGDFPGWGPYLAVSLVGLLLYLQLRVLDEFKDYHDDLAHRPYRPVARGLVRLGELAWLGLGAAALQALLCAWLMPSALPMLALVWAYMALMGKEFFAHRWLVARPVAYLLSHLLIVPLMQVFVGLWGGLGAEGVPGLVAVSLCAGALMELGRKIRLPREEEAGVQTYSALWGWRRALAAWAGVATAGAMAAAWASGRGWPLLALVGLSLAISQMHQRPERGLSTISAISALWVVVLHLALAFRL